MPRGPKKNANQHNNRHENGVVAPGRRVTRQKSNGHINGSPDGRSRANTPPTNPPSAPGQPVTQNPVPANPAGSNAAARRSAPGAESRQDQPAESLEIRTGESETDVGGPGDRHQVRRIDVSAAKPASLHEGAGGAGMAHFALTVLRSCSLRDTLAILVFLLSLPPTFQSLTNAAFAVLTFVPPFGSLSSLPTLSDISSSTSPNTPSFLVMMLIDFLAMILWLLLSNHIQALVLDWAQAMVATTLGGGYTNKAGVSDNTILCVGVVSAAHLSRYKRSLLRILHRTWIGRWTPELDPFEESPISNAYPVGYARPWLDTLKVVIALHVVSQGLTKMVRRTLHSSRLSASAASSSSSSAASTSSISDPEAVAGAATGADVSDQVHNPAGSPLVLRSKESIQSLRDGRDKISSGKRRRKQGNYVRGQQPLWAAFAATKATIMREYDQSQATSDATGSNATDVRNLGSAPFALTDGRIWITDITPGSFSFETSALNWSKAQQRGREPAAQAGEEGGVDATAPFHVRVNGADWVSVRVLPVPAAGGSEAARAQWAGEVYGLSPAYSYHVRFVRREDGVALHSETIATPASPTTEQASPSLPVPPPAFPGPRLSFPASPEATLRTSIGAFDAGIEEATAQQRRLRKESKAAIASLRKDIDSLSDRITKHSANERNLKARSTQQRQHIQQAEDAIASMTQELDSYNVLPEDEAREWQEQRSCWEAARDEHNRAQEDVIRAREQNTAYRQALQTEALKAKQHNERLQQRVSRLSSQHRRLTSPAATPENRRTNSGPASKAQDRYELENRYQESVNVLQQEVSDRNYRVRAMAMQVEALTRSLNEAAAIGQAHAQAQAHHASVQAQVQAQAQAQAHQAYAQAQVGHSRSHSLRGSSRPITPEGDLPGTVPVPTSARSTTFGGAASAFGTPESRHVVPASRYGDQNARGHGPRARSTSVLSGSTIWQECDDAESPLQLYHHSVRRHTANIAREGSSGGSSGSGSPRVLTGARSSPRAMPSGASTAAPS